MAGDKPSGPPPVVLRALPGGGEADALAEALRVAERAWPAEVEAGRYIARSLRAKYDALRAQGFTPAEALDLTKKWMWP